MWHLVKPLVLSFLICEVKTRAFVNHLSPVDDPLEILTVVFGTHDPIHNLKQLLLWNLSFMSSIFLLFGKLLL